MIPFIVDLVILVVIGLFVYFGFRNGMIKSIMLFISMTMSWIFSAGLTTISSEFIYLKFIYPYICKEVISVLSSRNTTISLLSEKLPNILLDCLSYCGITLSRFNHIINSVNKDMLPDSLNHIFMPIFMRILKPIIAGVLFFILSFLSKLIINFIVRIFKLKVLSAGNKLIGGLIGALKGYTFILVLICILRLLLPFVEMNSNNINISDTIYSTTILKYMYNNNPVCTILELSD